MSTSVTLGRLNAGRYSSLKVGRLQNWRYHGLSASAVALVLHDRIHARANLVHLFEIRDLRQAHYLFGRDRGVGVVPRDQQTAQVADDVGPSVIDQILVLEAAGDQHVEIFHAMLLPSRFQRLDPFGIGRTIPPDIYRGGGTLEYVEMLRVLRQERDALDRCRTGADNRDALVAELVQIPIGIAAGVSVVPAAGVEGVTLETVDALNPGQLRPIQRPVGHHDEPRAHPIVAVGGNDPPALVLAPRERFDLRLKACVAIQIELLADTPRMRQDFRRIRVLLFRDITGFLEQRQIDVRLDIALRAGIAVPVPGAAEVAALLDDANALDAGLAQPGARQQSAEAAANDHDVHRVVQRRTGEARIDIRIVDVTAEVALHFDVLFVAIGAKAFIAFLAIFGAQNLRIKIKFLLTIAGGRNLFGVTHRWKLQKLIRVDRNRLERYPSAARYSSTTSSSL